MEAARPGGLLHLRLGGVWIVILSRVTAAGLFPAAATVSKKILFVQAVPAVLALVLLWIGG
jgi:uncharacterized membrane protein